MAFKKKRPKEEIAKYQRLVEQTTYKKGSKYYKEMDHLCFLSKNLYNVTLYHRRQSFFSDEGLISFYDLKKKFVKEDQPDYRALPAKVSCQIQMLVDQNFSAFFALLKKKKNGSYDKDVHLPKYLKKDKGRQVVIYPKDALFFVKAGFVGLSKTKIFIPTKQNKENILQVRLVPKNGYVVVEVVYEVLKEKALKKKNRYAAIDIGMNNLMAISSNVFDPVIINGKPVKSINEFYNKKIAEAKSQAMTLEGLYITNRIRNLYRRRSSKLKDYMHKATAELVNLLVSNNIDTVIIGENKSWKQDINIGRKNNREFVNIPFYIMKSMIKYKCGMRGIEVIFHEESYTSKASFIDKDKIPAYNKNRKKKPKFSGTRVKRGLYKSADGSLVNADINGASNIMKKALLKRGLWSDVLFTEIVQRITKNPVKQNIRIA